MNVERLRRIIRASKIIRRITGGLFVLSTGVGGLQLADMFFFSNSLLGTSYSGPIIGLLMVVLTATYGTFYAIGEKAQEHEYETQAIEDKREDKNAKKIEGLLVFPGEVLSSSDAQEPSENILIVQLLLTLSGHSVLHDGRFGQQTREAVLAVQEESHVKKDGMVGKITWNELVDNVRNANKGDDLLNLYEKEKHLLIKAREEKESPQNSEDDDRPQA